MRPADNPFASHCLERLAYRFPEGEKERFHFYTTLHACAFRGALVGPKGHGKSTLLREIAAHLQGCGFSVRHLQLREEQPCLTPHALRVPAADEIILLDGAEQLLLPRWWHFRWRMRKARGLIITTHRAGRLPTLRRCTTSPLLLHDLALALGAAPDSCSALFHQHGGNLREALFECYEREQRNALLTVTATCH